MHNCRKLVENVEFFKDLPLALIVRIVSNMQVEIYLVNDVIIKVNSLGDSMYFIACGTVAVYSKAGKEVGSFDKICPVDVKRRWITCSVLF